MVLVHGHDLLILTRGGAMKNVLVVLVGVVILFQISSAQIVALQPANGPTPGIIQCFATSTEGVLFSGVFGEGIFKSMDQAGSWEPASNGLTNVNVLALLGTHTGDVFAGTFGGGIFRTADGGTSWWEANSGLSDREVTSFATGSDGAIYAGTARGGVFRSEDMGEHWTPVGLAGIFINSLAVTPSGEVVAAASGTGAFVLRKGEWDRVYSGKLRNDVLDVAVNTDGHIFLASNGRGVLRSVDGGNVWMEVNVGLADLRAGVFALTRNSGLLVGTSMGVYHSSNGGKSWTKVQSTQQISSIRCLNAGSEGRVFAGTREGQVLRSINLDVSMK